ncbi:hypothetical protein M3196_01700 [Fictibacillus nanhaiensis]|uniref:hypothetical protein n=1 Tax=Fictibacillus nanhaiensis TaxID=742169 RepID=UPI00203F1EBB|nr:hypothetical protein [Fictibacillus nanhaiensis]MCM3730379.1 hypothetical protein [Fictibacillus nanhaiensis]
MLFYIRYLILKELYSLDHNKRNENYQPNMNDGKDPIMFEMTFDKKEPLIISSPFITTNSTFTSTQMQRI